MSLRARPIYFIGDSNSHFLRYISVASPRSGERIVTVGARLVMRDCATLLCGDGLSEALESFLRYRLLGGDVVPAPVVVLMVGTLELAALLKRVGPRTEVPAESGGVLDGPFFGPTFAPLPSALLDRAIEAAFEPLRRAIALMRAIGVDRLVLHSLHPPTMDDVRYFSIRRVTCTARTRYATVMAVNRYFKRLAEETGIAFLDLWEATTVNGVLDERLSFDGDHLNYEGALLTIEALLRSGLF